MVIFKSIKTKLIIYLSGFAVFLAVRDKDAAFLAATAIAVISALAAEGLVLYLKEKAFRASESAVITGLITGFVISSDQAWWIFCLAAVIAIFSKHLIRFRGKHIFNPAACGIFLTLILFGVSTQWKGTYIWYILAPFGFYFAYKLKKTEVLAGYAAASLLLFGAQALLQNVPLWNIFGYFSYFYIFVMVIEPKTTPLKPIGKYIFGAGVAALVFILTQAGVRFDAELCSLLVMNATVHLLNKMPVRNTRS
ncbi:MAG: RnfABCDGE type electron transport complex subunit D [Candidatus Omnitrophica bacterium]|nr:RnfABCDGE type electron transport complex subunit D [Candidatus Omnitrophota bacterium]